ncbi:MAG TPA: class I SAM-dependent methyltransferase [bacterium]|nr:class I SAM-dependent methyltransferase [bacterium]
MPKNADSTPSPMPYTRAEHLLHPLRRLFQSPKRLVGRLPLKADSQVLELGPGPGYFSAELARSIPRGKLVLVDIQQEMLDMAKKRLSEMKLSNIEYRQADGISLPADDSTFDCAFLVSVLGEISDRDACLQEIHRTLRPGGILSITENKYFDPDYIPSPDLERAAHKAGFNTHRTYKGLMQFTMHFRKSV